jgi:hypothetical protein
MASEKPSPIRPDVRIGVIRAILTVRRSLPVYPNKATFSEPERHLRHLLLSYMNITMAPSRISSLGKDAPFSRAIEWAGQIRCPPTLGGLLHQYARN